MTLAAPSNWFERPLQHWQSLLLQIISVFVRQNKYLSTGGTNSYPRGFRWLFPGLNSWPRYHQLVATVHAHNVLSPVWHRLILIHPLSVLSNGRDWIFWGAKFSDPYPVESLTSLCVNPQKDTLTSIVGYIFLNRISAQVFSSNTLYPLWSRKKPKM